MVHHFNTVLPLETKRSTRKQSQHISTNFLPNFHARTEEENSFTRLPKSFLGDKYPRPREPNLFNMSGLVKAKKYDWKDSNMALFGSDTDKAVKKESAETEPAWKGAGQKVGVQIWRIVKFKVKDWPKEDYGKFFKGDSYIILNTFKEEEEIKYDVHFWIGAESTQDEYGTAAYKTVELDTLLDDKPVQHREVQAHESDMFKSYFGNITLLSGGADTGFRHVEPTQYKPRLFRVRGDRKKVFVKQVPLCKKSLVDEDVFILDLGLHIYQWNGATSNKDEKFKAVQYVQGIRSERSGKPKCETLDAREISKSHSFYDKIPEEAEGDDDDDDDENDSDTFTKALFRLSDASGQLEFNKVEEGELKKGSLASEDVFIVDDGKSLFVWIGDGASPAEKKNGLPYAHQYLKGTNHPLVSITCIKESQRNKFFDALFD